MFMVIYIIIAIIVICIVVCIGLHFMIIHELRDISEELTDTYNDFKDEMLLLAETLQVYHELLNNYQIPMIANPTREQLQRFSNIDSDW